MGLERLERVMWRLRKANPDVRSISNAQLRLAIMHECGTDPRTYKMNREALKRLGWVKAYVHTVWLTNKDITS